MSNSGERFEAELWQDGIVVAGVDCPDEASMHREIGHYALMYGQDGPVKIVYKVRRAAQPQHGG